MKKYPKGPTWKKGMISAPEYSPPQEPPDPEGHLTEEQKKWPVVDGWGVPPEKLPALPQDGQSPDPAPKSPPAA